MRQRMAANDSTGISLAAVSVHGAAGSDPLLHENEKTRLVASISRGLLDSRHYCGDGWKSHAISLELRDAKLDGQIVLGELGLRC